MINAARIALILMLCLVGGGMMLSFNESLITTVLVLGGCVVFLVGVNVVFYRSRIRRGKADNLSLDLSDVTSLVRNEWVLLFLLSFVSIGLLIMAAQPPGEAPNHSFKPNPLRGSA